MLKVNFDRYFVLYKLRHEKPDSAVPDIYVFMFKIYMLLILALATSFGGR